METPWDSSTPISTKPAAASWTTVKFRVRERDQAAARSMPLSGYRARIDTDNDGVPDAIERVLGRDPALAGFTRRSVWIYRNRASSLKWRPANRRGPAWLWNLPMTWARG